MLFTSFPDGFTDIRRIDPQARVVRDASSCAAGLPKPLRCELRALVRSRARLAFGILQDPVSWKGELEGRGVYHDIGEGRFVYVKGVGSHLAFRNRKNPLIKAMSKYPSYGKSKGDMFFDDPRSGVPHPRVLGAMTARWGKIEFVSSAAVFKQAVRFFGMTSLKEVRKAGLTIPIAVTHFPELSRLVASTMRKLRKRETNRIVKEALSLSRDFAGFGSVALEVPGNRRVKASFPFDPNLLEGTTVQKHADHPLDPHLYRSMGRTLRALLQLGFVYSPPSAHTQNIYAAPRSVCAQADNSDLILLGGRSELYVEGEKRLLGRLPAKDQQTYLIYQQLLKSFLPPAYLPDKTEREKSLRDAAEIAFFTEVFAGKIAKPVLKNLMALSPLYGNEIKLALATALRDRYDSDTWEETAVEHASLCRIVGGADLAAEFEDREYGYHLNAFYFYVRLSRIDSFQKTVSAFARYISTGMRSYLDAIPDIETFKNFRNRVSKFPLGIRERVYAELDRKNSLVLIGENPETKTDPEPWLKRREKFLVNAASRLERDPGAGLRYLRNL